MPESRTVKLKINATVHDRESLFFRQGIASAMAPDGEKVEVSLDIGSGSLLVRFGKSDWYRLAPADVVRAVDEARMTESGEVARA